MSPALENVAGGVERAFAAYPLLSSAATVAFSGGKDSTALAFALKSLGRKVRLQAVDMGYNQTWARRIRDLADFLGLPVQILNVASLVDDSAVQESARKELVIRRRFLERPEPAEARITPCTNCYNCKIISLVHGPDQVDGHISFAHHSTDAIASFFKSALMYYDRWISNNRTFDKGRFRALAEYAARDLASEQSSLVSKFLELSQRGFASTSEPPVELKSLHGIEYVIGRPLFFVSEKATSALVEEIGARVEGSGCGHSTTRDTRTPREIVHLELLPALEGSKAGCRNLEMISEMIVANLNANGTLRSDSRGNRHFLLGADYKGAPEQLADKL